jgi:NAD(P)-dependent dehydrogenase (short-subunit alcohol dehydrogenase family)
MLTQLGAAPYSVTKHAAVGFAEWLAIAYGDQGIGVCCVCPMGVDTPLLRAMSDSPDTQTQVAGAAVAGAGAVISPDQVADLVVHAIIDGTFLVLPHPEVLTMFGQKATDYDRWIAGMRRYQRSLQ